MSLRPFRGVAELRSKLSLSGKHAWAILDQATISAANLLISILLARSLGPAEFGVFTLLFMVILMATSLQDALIVQPMNIVASGHRDDIRAYHVSTLACAQLGLSFIFAMLVLAALLVDQKNTSTILAVAFCVFFWICQEFLRRVLYLRERLRSAFFNGLVSYGGQLLLITAMWLFGIVNMPRIFFVFGLTSACGVVLGIWQNRSTLLLPRQLSMSLNVLTQAWSHGRWLVGSSVLYLVSSQLYPVLTAGFVGVSATGAMRAGATLLGPTNVLIRATEAVGSPNAARIYHAQGTLGLSDYQSRLLSRSIPPMIIYCVGIAVGGQWIVPLLFGGEYGKDSWIVIAYALSYLLVMVGSILAISIRSLGLSKHLFKFYVGSAAVSLSIGVGLVQFFGLLGAAVGIVATPAMLVAYCWFTYQRHLNSNS